MCYYIYLIKTFFFQILNILTGFDNNMNLSKSKIKLIHSLEMKKFRKQENMFVAEGTKSVCDIYNNLNCITLIATQEWIDNHPEIKANEIITTSKDDISRASFQKTPQDVIALFEIPHYKLNNDELSNKLSIVLDTIQDPGNLGTIIRIADWFGIENIICSNETTDCFSPKVVQATMGAISRIKIHYTDLNQFLSEIKDIPVFGTFLEGENIYKTELSVNGLIIMGNEGNGIGDQLNKYINKKLHIPNFSPFEESSESLNVAVATAIICSELDRKSVV